MFSPDSVYHGKELSVSYLYEYLVYRYLVNKDLSSLSREHFCMQQEDCIKFMPHFSAKRIQLRYYAGTGTVLQWYLHGTLILHILEPSVQRYLPKKGIVRMRRNGHILQQGGKVVVKHKRRLVIRIPLAVGPDHARAQRILKKKIIQIRFVVMIRACSRRHKKRLKTTVLTEPE